MNLTEEDDGQQSHNQGESNIEINYNLDDEDMEPMDNHFRTRNYQRYFITEQLFSNRDELVAWVRSIGMNHKMILIIKGSRKGNGKGAGRVSIRCERGGNYVRTRSMNTPGARKTGTKKCECPFYISGVESKQGTWKIVVNDGTHNHDLVNYLKGHAFLGKLKEEELEFVDNLSKDRVKPQQIKVLLQKEYMENVSTMRHIYNARQKSRAKEMDGQTVLQHVMSILAENHYFRWHRSEPESNVISELLFANPVSVRILRAFPFVLEMECTYKTNRYGWPLLQIIGVTPTQMNFSVAFAFMSSEKEENYMWVLERLKTLMDPLMLPTTILTDRKPALIFAVERVFPTSKHLLCKFHVNCNVEKRCSKICGDAFARGFLPRWQNVLNSLNEETYEERLSELERDFQNIPSLLSYLKTNWLHPYKERLVSAWADQAFHLHQGTTNRIEGAYGKLKMFLETSTGSFNTILLQIHTLLDLQHEDIKESLRRSRLTIPHFATGALYANLRGYVTSFALELIQKERPRNMHIGVGESLCRCYLRRTHGLPCAHEINTCIHDFTPIPLLAIHPFWKKLDIDSPITPPAPQEPFEAPSHLLNVAMEAVMRQPLDIQNQLARQIFNIAFPHRTTLQEPEVRQCKGRPRNSSTRRDPSSWEYEDPMYSSCSGSTQG